MRRTAHCLIFLAILVGSPCLARAEDTTSVKKLLKDLRAPDYMQAWGAADKLARFSQYRAEIVPALIEALNHEWEQCSGDVRQVIAKSLVELGAKEAVFPLLQLVRSGKSIEHECVECGGCFLVLTPGDELLSRGHDPFSPSDVLWAVHQLADFSHLKTMADIVSEGKWKEQLITTIGKVGHPRYAYFIGGYKDDKAVGVRIAVAHGLGLITNDDFTLPVLIQLLSRSNEDFFVRWEASNALVTMGKRGDAQAVRKRLGDLLRDREKLTVLLTARALAILGEEKGSLKLREMAMDGDPKIRMEAVMYLGEVTDVGSKDILIKSVKDDNLAVRACAMYALGRIGDASMIATLRKAFEGSTDYMATLEKQLKASSSEEAVKQKYGVGVFDLRQTLQEAIDTIQNKGGKD